MIEIVDFGVVAWLRSLNLTQWLLRLVLALATLAGLGCLAWGTDQGLPRFWLVLAVVTLVWSVASPDSPAPAALVLVLALGWWQVGDGAASWWVLVLALCLVLIHAVAALAASGAPACRVESTTLVRWGRGVAAIGALVVATWLLWTVVESADVADSTVRLVVALVAVAGFTWFLRTESLGAADLDRDSRADSKP
jgi:hypothetical protein